MSCAALRTSLLAAREARQARLEEALAQGYPWVASLSLALPGAEKNPPGARDLFTWASACLEAEVAGFRSLGEHFDALGPWMLFQGTIDALSAKRIGIHLENRQAAARLLDADVYPRRGAPLSRASLGMGERSCLLCRWAARDCIRLQRHHPEEIIRAAHALIARFRPTSPG